MEFAVDLKLVRSQKLLLTPRLKQAIEILEMDSRELFQYVENQLDTNPALEEAPAGTSQYAPAGTEATEPIDFYQYTDMADPVAEQPERVLTLKQHLLVQLDSLCLDKKSYEIGEYLIDNTDSNGYMKADTAEAAACLGVPESDVLRVLEKLQSLEPPGICARNLGECLLIQLRQFYRRDADAELIVERFLDAVAKNDAVSIASETGMTVERINELFRKIRSLEPKPGRNYCCNDLISRTMPDIIIRDINSELLVVYNSEAFPNVCISESYVSGLSRRSALRTGHVKEWLDNAAWLIKCLEQREVIIFAIAREICELRRDFFRTGPRAFRHIDKNSFASRVCLHETILDKALAGKYLQCRWGLYELKSFFREA